MLGDSVGNPEMVQDNRKLVPPPDGLRPLLTWVAVAWAAGALSVALILVERQLRVIHPGSVLFLIFLAVTLGAALALLVRGLRRLARGHRRLAEVTLGALGALPLLFWLTLGLYGQRQWASRNVPHNLPMAIVKGAGARLMEAQARCLYPRRVESARLIMFHGDELADPEGDIKAMDRHVAGLEQATGSPLRAKIWWVRGSLLGHRGLALGGLALGSSNSPADKMDRHELAHAVIYHGEYPDTDPPTLLTEGWAEAQSVDSETLAINAARFRWYVAEMGQSWEEMTQGPEGEKFLEEFFRTAPDPEGNQRLYAKVRDEGRIDSYLRELTDPFWYHHDAGAVYQIGGAFVDFLLRRHGVRRFVKLYFTVRPGTLAADCKAIYSTDLDALEAQFWEDVEQRTRKPRP
jgi:hypothetical protein